MTFRYVRFGWSPNRSQEVLSRGLAWARAVGFWFAISLPMVYLPLVVVAPPVVADPTVIGSLVGANVLALVVGHGHEPSFDPADGRSG